MAKIVFAVSHSEHAGAQLLWADLAAALQERGHDVQLVAIYPGATSESALPNGLSWNYCAPRAPRSLLESLSVLRVAVRLMKSLSPDALLCALPAANTVFPLACYIAGLRLNVVTSHHSPAVTYGRIINQLDSLIGGTKAVTRIVCVSDAVKSGLDQKSFGYRAKSIVIRNALPRKVEEFTTALRTTREREFHSGRRLIACGRLAEQKNYPVLIRALQGVENATLDIIGSGPDEMSLRTLAGICGVADRVHFLGLMPREAALSLIAQRDIFLQPSLFEGHSLALIEAARIGVPMIVSNVPSQVEAVTQNDGTLCALTHGPFDFKALGSAIVQILDDPKTRCLYSKLAAQLGDTIRFAAMVDSYEAIMG